MSLLEIRNKMQKNRPVFVRQDPHKKRLKNRWVKPRGLHSKIRLKKAGHSKPVSDGYGSPKLARGLSKEGLKIVLVYNENELNKINKENEGVIISKSVGTKKKILLLNKAKEKGITILNLKVDEYLKKKEDEMKKRTDKKKKKEEKIKEKGKQEKKGDVKLEEKLSDEEKKEKDKKEKDKLLIKREL